MGKLELSKKEGERLRIVKAIAAGRMTIRKGGRDCDVSDRELHRGISRFNKSGAEGLGHRLRGRQSRTGAAAGRMTSRGDRTAMAKFREWLTKLMKNERLLLSDKNAVAVMSNINSLTQKKAKLKPMKPPKAKLAVVHQHQTPSSPKHRTRKYSSKFFANRAAPPKSWS